MRKSFFSVSVPTLAEKSREMERGFGQRWRKVQVAPVAGGGAKVEEKRARTFGAQEAWQAGEPERCEGALQHMGTVGEGWLCGGSGVTLCVTPVSPAGTVLRRE